MTHAHPALRHSLLLIAVAATLGLTLSGCKKAGADTTQSAAVRVSVETVPVTTMAVADVLQLTGTLRGERETDLAANVGGRIVQLLVERGQTVKRGQLLARVDVQAASLQLAEAKVQIATSKTQQEIDQVECVRYEQLKAHGAVTDLEYANVMARCKRAPLTIEAANARANLAAKSVGDGMIRAPFAGVVTDRFVEVGEYVQPSTRVVALADVTGLRLEFSVPEADYPAVKVGASLDFTVVAYGDRAFHGRVSYLGGAVRATRDVLVEAKVENGDGALLPGMFAKVNLTRGTLQRPAVPSTAIFEQNGKPNLFVVDTGVLSQRVVQVDSSPPGQLVPIRQGVSEGERVVAIRNSKLVNGMQVQ